MNQYYPSSNHNNNQQHYSQTSPSSTIPQVAMTHRANVEEPPSSELSLREDDLRPLDFRSTEFPSMDHRQSAEPESYYSARDSQTMEACYSNPTTQQQPPPPKILDPVDESILQHCACEIGESRWSILSSQFLLDPSEIQRVFDPPCTPTQFDVSSAVEIYGNQCSTNLT